MIIDFLKAVVLSSASKYQMCNPLSSNKKETMVPRKDWSHGLKGTIS